jgi:hypothetical protein
MGLGKSNKGTGYSGQIKLGNRTWINKGQLPTSVEQINFGLELVNNKHKRYIVNKTISSGISNNPLSLQETQLRSLVMTPGSATSCSCSGSPPIWYIGTTSCGCPVPIIDEWGCAVQSYMINYSGGKNYTITVNYNRCNPWSGTYTASATSKPYPNKNNSEKNQYQIQPNCIINQNITCTPGQGTNSCAPYKPNCINIT